MGYIKAGREQGADLISGGAQIGSDGYFIGPTVLQNVTDDMTIAREEIFGPVLCVLDFDDEDEAISRANDTEFGLAAGGWTQDVSRTMRLATKLQAGTLWLNTWGDTDAASPFGGMKQSGYGREMGAEAMSLYTQTKSIWLG